MRVVGLILLGCGLCSGLNTWRNGSLAFPAVRAPIPILQCLSADQFPVYDLCKPVIGNTTFSVEQNLTSLDEFVGKTFRSLIYVQNTGCRESIVNFACGVYYPLCSKQASERRCPCPSTVNSLKKNCTADAYGSNLAHYAITLGQNLTQAGRPCGNLNQSTGHGFGDCFHPHGATGEIVCPAEMVQPNLPGARTLVIGKADGPTWPIGGWTGGSIEACKLPCYPSLFSEAEARTSIGLVTSLAWVSTVASALLFVLFHADDDGKALHAWPHRLQVYFTLCVFFLSLALTFASMIGYSESMWCENAALCTIQALMLEYFGLALATWFLLICFNVFLSIVVYRKEDSPNQDVNILAHTESWEKIYHFVGWGVPGVFAMILACDGKLGYPVYGNPSYCWITDEDSSVWDFSFFFIEILVFVGLGLLAFGASLVKLRRLTAHAHNMSTFLRNVSRTCFFVLAFAFTFTFMGIYQVTLTSQEDTDRVAYDNYMQCIVKQWWSSSFTTYVPPCELQSHPDLVFMDIQSACFASLGIVTFFVFGAPLMPGLCKKVCKNKRVAALLDLLHIRRQQRDCETQSAHQSTVKDPGVNDATECLIPEGDVEEQQGQGAAGNATADHDPAATAEAGWRSSAGPQIPIHVERVE